MATSLKRLNYSTISNNYNQVNVMTYKTRHRRNIYINKDSLNILKDIIEVKMESDKIDTKAALGHVLTNGSLDDISNDEINVASNNKNNNCQETPNTKECKNVENDNNDYLKLNRDDFISRVDYVKARRRKQTSRKLYVSRKHHSDYDLVYLQIDDGNREIPRAVSVSSTEDLNGEGIEEDEFRLRSQSRSDSNISLLHPSSLGKSSSHKDITSTQMYKEIYADNLRQYGFLLAKKLGTSNKSPDQLRKSYLQNRQKAVQRRERALTGGREERKVSVIESPLAERQRLSKSHSNLSTCSNVSSLDQSKYSGSLTDISVIGFEADNTYQSKKTPVVRRKPKNHVPRDPLKRLSAPQLNTIPLEINVHHTNDFDRKSSLPNISPSKSSSLSSLNVPESSFNSSGSESDDQRNSSLTDIFIRRKMSQESMLRQTRAHERQQLRQSRLDSFEGILSQADKLMKDIKRRSGGSITPLHNKENDFAVHDTDAPSNKSSDTRQTTTEAD